MLNLKKLLAKLLKAPVIIETGTSGSAAYEKWSNGVLRYYGYSIVPASNSGYATYDYPVHFKTGTNPKGVANVRYTSGIVVGATAIATTVSKLTLYTRNINGQMITVEHEVDWIIWGYWK